MLSLPKSQGVHESLPNSSGRTEDTGQSLEAFERTAFCLLSVQLSPRAMLSRAAVGVGPTEESGSRFPRA